MKYLIVSANGYGNVGDDLIARAVQGFIIEADPKAEVKLTRPPYDPTLMSWTDAVFIGGGGILYDHDELQANVNNYMQYAKEADQLKKPIYVIGIGEQGITTNAGREAYKTGLNLASLITARSQKDKQVLVDEVGVTQPVYALQDVVFALPLMAELPLFDRLKLMFRGHSKPRLAFCLPRLGGQGFKVHQLGDRISKVTADYETYLASQKIDPLFDEFDVTLVCQSRDDVYYYTQLRDRFKAPLVYAHTYEAAPQTVKTYLESDIILTGRFHGLILAAMLGKPVAAVGISGHKLDKLINEGLPSLKGSFFPLEQFVGEDICAKLRQLYDDKKLKTADPAEVGACRQVARQNVDLIKQALQRDLKI